MLVACNRDMATNDDIVGVATVIIGHASQGTEEQRYTLRIDGRIVVTEPIHIIPPTIVSIVEVRALRVTTTLGHAAFGGTFLGVPFNIGHAASSIDTTCQCVRHDAFCQGHRGVPHIGNRGVVEIDFLGNIVDGILRPRSRKARHDKQQGQSHPFDALTG